MSARNKLAKKRSKLTQVQEPIANHPADTTQYKDRDYAIIPIGMIHPDPLQPRKNFDEEALRELSETIREKGVLQPVIVRMDGDGKIWLVAGERRFRASGMAGLTEMPAIVSKGNPAEISLIENIQREDLKPVEEADALKRMMDEYDYTQEQLAQVVGKARSTVTQTLSLCSLPQVIRQRSVSSDVSRRVLIEIARKESEEEMVRLYDQAEKGFINSNTLRKPPVKRERASRAEATIKKIDGLCSSLAKLKIDGMGTREKKRLFEKLAALEAVIEEIKQ